MLAVYDGSNNLIVRFEYADSRMPVAMTRGGETYYLTYDQVGSLKAVADSAGNVVKRIDYDSFGNIINDTNTSFEMPFGFAGGLHDRDAGLVRFGYRDYDPDIGRWTAKDPIGFAGGDTDLFGYCLSDPVNAVDPLGLLIRHWGEDKLPPWLRDKRTDSEREAAHQKYNEDLKGRLNETYPLIYWLDPPTWPFHYYEHNHKDGDVNGSMPPVPPADNRDNPCE